MYEDFVVLKLCDVNYVLIVYIYSHGVKTNGCLIHAGYYHQSKK